MLSSGSPSRIAWQVGDCCACRLQGLGWARAVITSLEDETAEVLLCDHGQAASVALRLLRPLPDEVCNTDWLSFYVNIVFLVPDNFQWSQEIVKKLLDFRVNADRVTCKASDD